MEKFLTKRLFIVALVIMMGSVVFGQQIRVSGTVTDASDGSALPGVNVLVKGTLTGAATDLNGNYIIPATSGDILVFSFIGYLSQEISVGNQTVINIKLSQDVQKLDEVVVIGYGTVRKSDATGSVQAIDLDHFNPGAVSSPQEMIIGKMAGVQVTTGGGAPGESATIRIRGGSSLKASNDPLIVIDGVPVDTDGPTGMRNPLSAINANDIETYTVLKDASATAIYGSRASNGVIIITTKKGLGNKFTVNYSGNVSYSTPIKMIEPFSAAEFRDIINTRYGSDPLVTANIGDFNTDWLDEIFDPALSHDHNLSFSGGVKSLPYRASVGYTSQNGILKTDNLKRVTGSINLNPTFLDDHLKIDISAKGMYNDNFFANRSAIGAALTMDPTQPVKDGTTDYTGGYFFWRNLNGTPLYTATMNPVAQLNLRYDTSVVKRLIGNVTAEYKVHFLPDLKLKINLGLDKSASDGEVRTEAGSPIEFSTYGVSGKYNVYSQTKTNSLLDMYFDYSKAFGGSRLNVVGGYSWQHFEKCNKSIDTNGAGTLKAVPLNDPTEFFLISFFGRANYVIADRYLFTVTLRDDASSRFSPETRWGLFPSAAFGWNISKEPFFANDIVSNLKLRLGYGVTGQQNITSNDYPYQANYTGSTEGASVIFGTTQVPTFRPGPYDPDIKWEETTTYNVGLDYGFLDDRITGEIDAYYKYTKDLINEIPVSAGTNFANKITTNVGNMENRGLEFSVNGKIIANSDMYWELGFNATYNENKITKLVKVKDPTDPGSETGSTISGGVGNYIQINTKDYAARSFYVYHQVYTADGMPADGVYIDADENGEINSLDKYRFHSPDPKVFMGFSSIFRYKAIDFNFNGRINLGNYIYNNVSSSYGSYKDMGTTTYLSNRVKSLEDTQFQVNQLWSDYYMENGSFMKLDNVSLGYTLKDVLGKATVRASFTAQNLITITKYTGLDPEVFDGVDNNIYPRPRIFMLGLSVTL